MKISCFFSACTIRQRLIFINSMTIVFVFVLISIYTFQLITVENNLVTMERVDDLFSSILGLRRYEKNIMLKLDEDNVAKATQSISIIEMYLNSLKPEIMTEEGNRLFIRLEKDFNRYETTFNRWCSGGGCLEQLPGSADFRLIRQQGQELVESAVELARLNRKTISGRFKTILFWLTFLPAIVFSVGVLLFFSQVKNILDRLGSLKKATKSLAAGKFKPVVITGSPDEITQLILNFNQMGVELEEKQEQLIQSKKMASIGTFSSGIAHEINNPLNNISLSTDTLLEEIDTMGMEERKEILDDIMAQTERASKIVRNLLDFSRAQSAEMQVLYIDYILHTTMDLISNELQIHQIELVKKIADRMPQINGGLQQLQQVFLNLVINAEQAIGESGEIIVKSYVFDDNYIRTDIIDNGPGIIQENMEQIFDPFFTTKEAGKGTGLGLSIVYGIVKKHGGYIEVASVEGKGTTFSVYLPTYQGNKKGTN